MIKKILIAILLIFLVPNSSFSKAPPLGTGSLVPSNIMIMLDNSGSMAWDLGGTQLTSDSFLNRPYDIETDSAGNVYVLQSGWTYNSDTGKNYRIHKFNSDGELQSQFLEYGGNWHRDRPCGKQYYWSKKFAIHNDQIYIVNQGFQTLGPCGTDSVCQNLQDGKASSRLEGWSPVSWPFFGPTQS